MRSMVERLQVGLKCPCLRGLRTHDRQGSGLVERKEYRWQIIGAISSENNPIKKTKEEERRQPRRKALGVRIPL